MQIKMQFNSKDLKSFKHFFNYRSEQKWGDHEAGLEVMYKVFLSFSKCTVEVRPSFSVNSQFILMFSHKKRPKRLCYS